MDDQTTPATDEPASTVPVEAIVTWLRDKCAMRLRKHALQDAAWLADAANRLEAAFKLLEQVGEYGEDLWDAENFRDGYKKIDSGLLVDCRKLLRGEQST